MLLILLMLILFDHGTPRGIARSLTGHQVRETQAQGWDRLTNGELLAAAEAAGFDVLLTTDRNIRYQQNLKGRRIAVVVLGRGRWRLIRFHRSSLRSMQQNRGLMSKWKFLIRRHR
jgi:hypothetical protein